MEFGPFLCQIMSLLPCHPETVRGNIRLKPTPFWTKFPLAESVGIFVGILAWDLLSEGHSDLLKASAITLPCALAWCAIRCWQNGSRNQKSQSRVPEA